jgi:hypothetical protein
VSRFIDDSTKSRQVDLRTGNNFRIFAIDCGDSGVGMESKVFGDEGKFYAAHQNNRMPGSRSQAIKLKQLLDLYDPDLRIRVDRAFGQWNNVLRDYLRNETGLRLSVGDDKRAVPVRIDDGLPLPFQQVMDEFPNPEIWRLQLQSEALSLGARGLEAFENDFGIVSRALENVPASIEDVRRVRDSFEMLNEWLKKLAILKRIGEIRQDVLGAYFFRIPEIRLYWMVIGLLSRALGVSAESLTVVVAVHELAHAYSHLGRDIDGARWDTEAFARTELEIAEGLAQFYTRSVCIKLQDRFPPAKSAYEALLAVQTGPYKAHAHWGSPEESTGEVVRFTMIKTRSNGIATYEVFKAELDRVRNETSREDHQGRLFDT